MCSYDMMKSKQTQHRRHLVSDIKTQTKRAEHTVKLREAFYWLLLSGVIAGCYSAAVFPRFRGRIGTIVQICWFVVIFTYICFVSYMQYLDHSIEFDLQAKLYIPETFIYLANIFFLMAVSVRRRHLLGNLIEIIVDFDLANSYSLGYERLKRFVHYHMLFILIFAFSTSIIDFRFNKYVFFKFLCSSGAYVLPNILICISLAHYYVLLYGVVIRLHDLIQTLESMFKLTPGAVENVALQQIRLQHTLLIRFTKKVNQIYGLSMLFIYVGAFINCSVSSFLLYKNLDGINPSQWALLAYSLICYGLHSGKIFTIVYVNHCIQEQQRKFLELFSKSRCEDADLAETVNQYVLLLQANVRAHVACGLMVLDLKLLKTLLMAVTNSFIFLLQYDITYEALKLPQAPAIQKV